MFQLAVFSSKATSIIINPQHREVTWFVVFDIVEHELFKWLSSSPAEQGWWDWLMWTLKAVLNLAAEDGSKILELLLRTVWRATRGNTIYKTLVAREKGMCTFLCLDNIPRDDNRPRALVWVRPVRPHVKWKADMYIKINKNEQLIMKRSRIKSWLKRDLLPEILYEGELYWQRKAQSCIEPGYERSWPQRFVLSCLESEDLSVAL